MADISNVDLREIKDLYESLESLSCKTRVPRELSKCTNRSRSSYHDPRTLLVKIKGDESSAQRTTW